MIDKAIAKITDEREELLDKIVSLEKKMQNSSAENTLMFKLKVDLLQETFADCKDCIDAEEDEGKKEKMEKALATVIDSIRGGI